MLNVVVSVVFFTNLTLPDMLKARKGERSLMECQMLQRTLPLIAPHALTRSFE
jgi:hypothetical protein